MNLNMSTSQWLLPDLLWTNQGSFEPGLAVGIDQAGLIAEIQPASSADVRGEVPIRRLPKQALIPGFVNTHSHAFQRSLRGRTEHLLPGRESDDFWSWRELMYELALSVDPDSLYASALLLYQEMLAAGYTSVGEFHYLHHRPDGTRYDDPSLLSRTLIQAAIDAGIRISLLAVLYMNSGLGAPPLPKQRRFISPDLPSYLKLIEPLVRDFETHNSVSIGLAPHSIRAVPLDALKQLASWNTTFQLPVHMHVCEQTSEIAQTRAHLGVAPIEAIASTGLLNEHFVGIHATHLEPHDAELLSSAGAKVCACPSTEANLGDGFLPALSLMSAGVPISIGSDSHAVVNPFEELRLIENNERLQHRRRNVLAGLMQPVGSAQDALRVAPGLLACGTQHGADALKLNTGQSSIGFFADFLAVDLDDPYVRGVHPSVLAEALVFSAAPRCIREVFVGGTSRWRSS